MYLKELKGLKFPDLAVIKFFFKNGLHKLENQKVLEYACSNGNNLSLFANYDFECLGVDLSEENLNNAHFNFKEVIKAKKFEFFNENIIDFAKKHPNIKADIFMIPNVVNYLKEEDFILLLQNAREYKAYKEGAWFFIRTRSIKDYRYGLGKKLARNSFLIEDDDTTGEKGCINTLYQEYELVAHLQKHLNLHDFKVLNYESTNVMGSDDRLVNDSDIVIYGKIG
ncbi:flaz protein [Campylobacter sp. MIT 12-8780]|uniref:methyltransferase domain-containing protein n=1 Tax=unclassified Campylobacter TaxID=2593542 RepID=UPI00115CDF94|nr:MULTISPECIES: class I SAM-dependent methyltransferase [unclassified Campylobacter]NDJ26719.1 class I SAM-dependent methyltransferase [Campylobacter sp. MIT 19-121]TQR42456.1 flaz protein [Campylobacter sp. MIT 12-8780]